MALIHHCAGPVTETGQHCLRCGVRLSTADLTTSNHWDENRLVLETNGELREPMGRPHKDLSEEGRAQLELSFGDMVRSTLCSVH